MLVVEIVSLILAIIMCVLCTKSDIIEGVIYNKILVVFSVLAVVIDSVYYGYFARDLLLDFIPNLIIVTVISLSLFYSHSFAGGDCKMTIVLALLYPARCYLVYGTSITTLFFSLGFAIFAGYLYLLASSIRAIITKKVSIKSSYMKTMLLNFLKSYISAMSYITLVNCILLICSRYGISINVWISRCICLFIAWCIGRFPLLSKKALVIPVYIIEVVISVLIKIVPISLSPENYILILVLLLCQMAIRTTLYETISINNLHNGMILSTLSSVLMQKSITKGLPGVSTEDLKSRLTGEEIESIKIWAKATHTGKLTIVKKIPFAIFIFIGFLSYFMIWSIVG